MGKMDNYKCSTIILNIFTTSFSLSLRNSPLSNTTLPDAFTTFFWLGDGWVCNIKLEISTFQH